MPGDESIASAPLALELPTKLTTPTVPAVPAPTADSPEASTLPADALSEILSNNEEYMVVYWAVEALKSQLRRARSDMQMLVSLRQQALARPLEYVEALVDGSAPRAPPQQAVVEVPSVYLEPYLSCADPEAIEEYIGVVKSVLSANDIGKYRALAATNKVAGSSVIKSTPIRHLPPAMNKAALHASRPPSSTNFSLLTGNTVVATPYNSPRPQPALQSVGSIESAALTAAPTATLDLIPAASSTSSAAGTVPVAPAVVRANTEPIYCAPQHAAPTMIDTAVVSEIAAETSQPPAMSSSKSYNRVSVTQPGSPTKRGQSQKTLTPQILES
ncbi:hypothetical protein GGI18_002042, partial [Coemansia linderi]